MHPLAANKFSKQIKRVQVFNNEMKSGSSVHFSCFLRDAVKLQE